MLPDVGREERADRDHLKTAFAGRCERGADEQAAETLPFVGWRDFGVSEYDLARSEAVLSDGEAAIAEIDFEAMLFGVVANCRGDSALTKLSSTFLRPACSKSISSLLPSMTAMVP